MLHVRRNVTFLGGREVHDDPKTTASVCTLPVPRRVARELWTPTSRRPVPRRCRVCVPHRTERHYSRGHRARRRPLAIHELRHTAATIANHNGATDLGVCTMLGHSNLTVTRFVYLHTNLARLDSVAASIDAAAIAARANRADDACEIAGAQ